MVSNSRIQDLIREDRSDEITDAIAAGEFFQMQTFAQSLVDLVIAGVVDREVAANAATDRHDFLVVLERAEKEAAAEQRERLAAEERERQQAAQAEEKLGASLRGAEPVAAGLT
jgi:Tfp pilus assembly ATPase PilU